MTSTTGPAAQRASHQQNGLPAVPLGPTTVDAPAVLAGIFLDNGLRTDGRHDVAHVDMPPVGAQCQALDPFRAVNSSVGPLIRYFWMQIGLPRIALLDLWLGLSGKRISHDREVLRAKQASAQIVSAHGTLRYSCHAASPRRYTSDPTVATGQIPSASAHYTVLCYAGTAGNNPEGRTAEVLLAYHSSRSAKSTLEAVEPGKFHVGLVNGTRTSS